MIKKNRVQSSGLTFFKNNRFKSLKHYFILVGFHIATVNLFLVSVNAEEISTATTSKTESATDLTEAFQREYTYLASQKSALLEQKKKLEKSMNQKIESLNREIAKAQKDIVWLGAENDENHEYLLTLERRKKDLQKRDSSLESVYKKAHTSLEEFRAGLYFETLASQTSSNKIETLIPTELKIEDFQSLMTDSKDILLASRQIEDFPSSFLNTKDKLVDGTVTRIGRSAAIGFTEGEYFILGPDGKGMLKALESTSKPEASELSLYIFDSLNKIAEVKKHGGVTEKLADLSPILFLGMMLMMVLGLFVAMIRV